MTTGAATRDLPLADLIGSLDDETCLVAVAALESRWRDRHSCADGGCWGFTAYPADWFTRILEAAVKATGKPDPVFCDAGAGIGTKVLLAARAGCQAYGIEHNPHYVTEASRLNADVRNGDIRSQDYAAVDIAWIDWPLRDPDEQIAFEQDVAAQLHPGAVLALGNRVGPAPAGWEQLTSVIDRDGAWKKPG